MNLTPLNFSGVSNVRPDTGLESLCYIARPDPDIPCDGVFDAGV